MLNRAHPFLGRALALSLVLHAALIAAPGPRFEQVARSALTVWLQDRPAAPSPPALPQPPLILPPQSTPPRDSPRNANAARPAPATPPAASLQWLSGEAARRASEQLGQELVYPAEAIERGLQGEALVLLFLDESGNAVAARLEASSGHALLDDAAVRAARSLRSLAQGAPREALLPVRFRLR